MKSLAAASRLPRHQDPLELTEPLRQTRPNSQCESQLHAVSQVVVLVSFSDGEASRNRESSFALLVERPSCTAFRL